MNGTRLAIASIALAFAAPSIAADPIIDMHVHTNMTERVVPERTCSSDQTIVLLPIDPATAKDGDDTEQCAHPLRSEITAVKFERATIAALRAANVRRALAFGPIDIVERWKRDAPDLIIPASYPSRPTKEQVDALAALAADKRIVALAEISPQYAGLRADDPVMEPFWSLAENQDLMVGIHLGIGMPIFGQALAHEPYRASLISPFQLEEVLHRHPHLRIYVMHYASPLVDEMLAIMMAYPTIYVDVSAMDWTVPRAQFYSELKRLTDAGLSKRIMFGSDHTIFPQAIKIAIQSIQHAPFLSAAQKRDILYNNAARFLRLTSAQVAADHAPLKHSPRP